MVKLLETSLFVLRIASRILLSNFIFTTFAIGIVVPLIVLGVTWNNVIFWTLTNILYFVDAYYFAMDWVYIWGSWFICKSHLDIQADYLIESMERLVETNGGIEVKIKYLEAQYERLVSRVKTFDELSRDLISPYRFIVSYVGGISMFFAHQTDNVLFQVAIDSIVAVIYVLSLSFLSTACSLSNRRRRMYFLANCLFVKMIGSSRGHSLRERITLRRMVKSLGDDDCHTLCLTDKSGEEFALMEFVEFILGTFSDFTLAVGLYNDYVK
jgi:hypothetical protein